MKLWDKITGRTQDDDESCKCRRCGKPVETEALCWVRITDEAGGKIKEKPVCMSCARSFANLLSDY